MTRYLDVSHAKIVEHGREELFLRGIEIPGRLVAQNGEQIDHLFRGWEVGCMWLVGIRDLSEMHQCLGREPHDEGREIDFLVRFRVRLLLDGRGRSDRRPRARSGAMSSLKPTSQSARTGASRGTLSCAGLT